MLLVLGPAAVLVCSWVVNVGYLYGAGKSIFFLIESTSCFVTMVQHYQLMIVQTLGPGRNGSRDEGAWCSLGRMLIGSWFYSCAAGRRENRGIYSLAASIQEGI